MERMIKKTAANATGAPPTGSNQATRLAPDLELTLLVLAPLPILSITIYYVSNIINRRSEAVQKQQSLLSTLAGIGAISIQPYLQRNSITRRTMDLM